MYYLKSSSNGFETPTQSPLGVTAFRYPNCSFFNKTKIYWLDLSVTETFASEFTVLKKFHCNSITFALSNEVLTSSRLFHLLRKFFWWNEVKLLSCVQLFAIPWTVAYQAPLSNAEALPFMLSDINIVMYFFFWLIFAWHIFIHFLVFKPLVRF